MKTFFFYVLMMVLVCHPIYSQPQIRVSGIITDAHTGERLIGATIVSGTNGTTSDHNGHFSWSMASPADLQFSFMGYTPYGLLVNKDTIVNIPLVPGQELSEVVVAEGRVSVSNVSRLNNLEMQTIPSISGKPDVMKAIQLLPGIQSQTEGSSLLLVRGGNPGENMYLFDNVPVIYVNHLGGMLSVFNPDIINSLEVYKGSFPSRFGGKLSSIVNITQKEGDLSKMKGSIHMGLTDLSMTIEGPVRENTSFIFTGRKTLFDYIFRNEKFSSETNPTVMSYGFHDLNGKLSFKPNIRNSFHLNFYQGDDYLMRRNRKDIEKPDNKYKMNYIWGNWLVSGGWKHMISPRLFVDNTIAYSRYRLRETFNFSFRNENIIEDHNHKYLSTVQLVSGVSDWKYQAHQLWNINFGINSKVSWSMPNYSFQSDTGQETDFQTVAGYETAMYLENRIELPYQFLLIAGARGVNYITSGFSANKLEPRLSLYKEINRNHEINMGYMMVNQFSHLLFTSGSIMNNEVWVPADQSIKPSSSRQLTFGWNGRYLNGAYQTELNLYHKTLSNLATYKEGLFNLKGDDHWKSKIETQGKGEAYGVEFLARKNTGVWTGFVAYTWSRATRQFDGINNGREYRFEFDRPHALSLSLSHHFNRRISLNATWIYQTGLPYTPAIGRQLIPSLNNISEGIPHYYEAFIYGERNSANMKDYHRLDVSLNFNSYTADNFLQSTLSFGLYNAYNRKNPLFYYYNNTSGEDYIDPEYSETGYVPVNVYQYSMFPIIPTISYKYFFEKGRKDAKSPGFADSYIKKRWNIKFSGSQGSNSPESNKTKFMKAEINYGFFRYLEAGIFAETGEHNLSFLMKGKLTDYGLVTNIHLIPLLVKREMFWLDLYLAGKLGGRYYDNDTRMEKNEMVYHYGVGVAIYPYKYIGFFAEYGRINNPKKSPGQSSIEIEPLPETRLRYGLTVKF